MADARPRPPQAQDAQTIETEGAHASPLADECLVCRARDDLDRAATRRWLTQQRVSRREALGIACCPRHTWRLQEIRHDVRDGNDPTRVLDDIASAASAAPRAPDDHTRQHAAVAQVLQRTMHTLYANLDIVARRFARRGVFRYLAQLGGGTQAGLLEESPHCVLCEHVATFEAATLSRFERICTTVDSATRQELARWRCPHDQRLTAHLGERFPEMRLSPRPPSMAPRLNWWQVPGYREDTRPFVARLLDDERGIPDTGCPACWMRGEQEQMLLVLLRETVLQQTSGAAAGEVASGTVAVTNGRDRRQSFAVNDLAQADLCAHHTAVIRGGMFPDRARSPSSTAVTLSLPVPAIWPAGTLRATTVDPHCSLCLAIEGWDATRLWGLQRAAGSALLFDDITQRLRLALERRQTGLCLPHWRRATVAVWPEVVQTLFEWQHRATDTLAREMEAHTREVSNLPSEEDPPADACVRASSVLGGYPA